MAGLPAEGEAHHLLPVNLFSSDPFLRALAAAAFPNRPAQPQVVRCEGRRFRILNVDGEPLTRWPFLDFHEAWEGEGDAVLDVGYLSRASVLTVPVDRWSPRPQDSALQPSPSIRWGAFSGWEDFTARVSSRNGNLFPDSQRKLRRLERDVGPVEFVLDDRSREVFEAALRWKSRQYLETGLRDLFADPRNVRLFEALREQGLAAFSALRAGGVLIACHLGAIHEGRMYWWVPAYDPSFARYSPGRLMLHAMVEASFRAGHAEFDFLIGDEGYKWLYATDVRVVAPLGQPPLGMRVQRAAKAGVKSALQRFPGLWDRTAALRSRLRGG